MTAQDVIQGLKSATVDEIAQIRNLLRIPDPTYGRAECKMPPKDLGTLWNRTEQRVENPGKP